MKKILGTSRSCFWVLLFFCLTISKAAESKTDTLAKVVPSMPTGKGNAGDIHANAKTKENFRLVVSAGALMAEDPFRAFYHSRLFQSEENPPLIIIDPNAVAFETDSMIFYSPQPISAQDVVAANNDKKTSIENGLIGHSYRGLLLQGTASSDLRQYLGADSHAISVVKHSLGTIELWAMSKSMTTKALEWPKSAAELRPVPAIIVSDIKGTAKYLMVARSVGDSSHRLGLVDSLVTTSQTTTNWVDLGTNHGQARSVSLENLTAVKERKPSAVFLGTWELMAKMLSPDAMSSLPVIYPFGDQFHYQGNLAGIQVNFWSASGSENLWSLYGKLGKRMGAVEMIDLMKNDAILNTRNLNIVRAFSEETAAILAKSVFVDLVLLLAKDPYAQLPTKEIMELKEAKTDAYEQVAPVVRIAYPTVSEIKIFGPSPNQIQRVEVIRHVVNDNVPRAKDVPLAPPMVNAPGLPSLSAKDGTRLWTRGDLEKIMGGIMLEQSKADLAIFAEPLPTTSIKGEIPYNVAKNILAIDGNVALITINGRTLKRIGKFINANSFNKKFSIYGMDTRTGSIGKRVINDNERFQVALSEDALLEIFSLSRLGGLGEEYAIRAPFIEAIYADAKQLFFIGGPKIIGIADTNQEVERAIQEVKSQTSFDDMLSRGLAHLNGARANELMASWQGKPHHVLTLEINYLDVGISKNATNENYIAMSENFPTSRGSIAPFLHLFLLSKISLNYDAPLLQTTLFNDTKYMHTKMNEKPEKDKTKFGLKFRIPWERSLFAGRSIVVAPVLRTVYETKLAPHIWPRKLFEPNKKPLVPTERNDILLGFNIDFTEWGFGTNIGGVMAVDFTRTNVNDAIDFGPGLDFYSKWNLFGPLELSSEVSACYLFPLPENAAARKVALYIEGTAWLRLARFYDFSVAAVSDFLVATLQESPKKVGLSSIFGLTVSYGRLFRLFG